MSLKTKILTTTFMFMFLVFILLTVNLHYDLYVRNQHQTRLQSELVARMVNSWVMESVSTIDPEHPKFWHLLAGKMERSSSIVCRARR